MYVRKYGTSIDTIQKELVKVQWGEPFSHTMGGGGSLQKLWRFRRPFVIHECQWVQRRWQATVVASIASYIQRKCKSVWIYFVNYIVESIVYLQGDYFPIYSCNGCTVMEAVQGMHLEQSRDGLSSLQCIHSIAVGLSFPRWEDHWNINDLYDTDL